MAQDVRGPQVSEEEDLYRAIIHPPWWKNGKLSSAAFSYKKYSVDVSSLTTPENTLQRFKDKTPGAGLAALNCGIARNHRFDARLETDPNCPDNKAHAIVYYVGSENKRKTNAKKLMAHCHVLVSPKFQ